MANLTEEEAKLVETIQKAAREAKQAHGVMARALTDLMQIQQDAGRLDAQAAAMEFRAGVRGAQAELDRGHAAGTRGLCDCYDDGGAVIFGGGGGR